MFLVNYLNYFVWYIIMTLELIKKDDNGTKYQGKNFKIYYRKKGDISGDNSINPFERIYLISGSALITLEKQVFEIESPYELIIPEKTYHRINALTDICFLIFTS